jgi:FtsP/CotA-like multicopper oxidase with cupredoxin domain
MSRQQAGMFTAGALAGIVVALLLVLKPDLSAQRESSAAEAAMAAHAGHLPPTKGSHRYQYATPTPERRFDPARVFDPYVPPPTPAPGGVREFTLVIEEDVPHEVAPGVTIPVWAINGTVPGPVLRATEGDRLRITLVNKGSVPHTLHFHGIHPANMDGVFELVAPGDSFTYEFTAGPYGILPFHCHAMPASQHIQNGLYGMLIVDPKQGRKPMKELAMMMSAFDIDRDGEADFYTWNGRAFQYADNPIPLAQGEPVRMYVANMFEEAMVPHTHGTFYNLFPTGTTLEPTEYTDVKTLNIAERAILEFQYEHAGSFMFQCHISEHMEQGLMGWFRVEPRVETSQARGGGAAGSSP